jgi:hypothetical protein
MAMATPTAAEVRDHIFELVPKRSPTAINPDKAPPGFHKAARFETQPCRYSDPCPKLAGRYADLCDEHAVKVYKCRVGPSGVMGGGDGLFVCEDFEKGDVIDIYDGDIIPYVTEEQKAAENERNRPYGFLVRENECVIDAVGTQSCIARYINYSSQQQANCEFRRFVPDDQGLLVSIHALRPLVAGEELLVNYGEQYDGVFSQS